MDEIVRCAMAHWPNVPAVCGWLRLDRRGNWLLRLAEGEPAQFDRITNRALIEFIGRNYACDDRGRYYFQNGPQRAYATLDYTPWVVRVGDRDASLVTQTDELVSAWSEAFLDEEGALVLATNLGAALVLDRDLDRIVGTLADGSGKAMDAEAFFANVTAGREESASLHGRVTRFASIRTTEVPARLAFVRQPAL
ncbi:MAG: DUF2946 family protein [Betaproteobacteria bacterium]|nr:DUF2946 family protein [Betaproteobacteria bacterium]